MKDTANRLIHIKSTDTASSTSNQMTTIQHTTIHQRIDSVTLELIHIVDKLNGLGRRSVLSKVFDDSTSHSSSAATTTSQSPGTSTIPAIKAHYARLQNESATSHESHHEPNRSHSNTQRQYHATPPNHQTTNQTKPLNTDENKSTTVHSPEQAGHHYEAYKKKTKEHDSSKTNNSTYYATQAQTLQELILRSSPMQHPLSTISSSAKTILTTSHTTLPPPTPILPVVLGGIQQELDNKELGSYTTNAPHHRH